MSKPLLTVVGAGAGIGLATARRFGSEGYEILLLARREDAVRDLCKILADEGINARYRVADVRDEDSLGAALAAEGQDHSNGTHVLLYNAARIKWKPLLDESAASLADDFQINVAGALTAVRAVLPEMQARQQGTILLTGSMFDLSPTPDFGSLSIGKAGLRNLGLSLATSLTDANIRVAYLSVDGRVSDDDPDRNPTAIADMYWRIHNGEVAGTVVNI